MFEGSVPQQGFRKYRQTTAGKIQVPLAIVHHANQYLITEGYDNKYGLTAILGAKDNRMGLSWVLELHRTYQIPANLHLSGTLLEAIAWHQPAFLLKLQEMYHEGLIEIVGSCYGQNIMRFFSYEHNLRQLNEELQLYQIHLGLDPVHIKTFWPPERLWDTERLAPVLRDPRLLNDGYQYVLVDDRVLLTVEGNPSPRHSYDREPQWNSQLFQPYRLRHGQGLIALPIARHLRQSIPPRGVEDWRNIQSQLQWLSTLDPDLCGGDFVAIYGDDMEKAAGVGGWDREGPSQFEAVLRWLSENSWIKPVKLSEWASVSRVAGTRRIEIGTFQELANHFEAGEDYEKWYYDPRWSPYRAYFSWSESRVKELSCLGADPTLIELAEKQLLASNWETAWHTPSTGAHGHPDSNGDPSAWIKALASHSRHAAVMAEAAFWMRHKDDEAHAYMYDIDNDGEEELILKNDKLVAVLSPRWGGRLVYLFSVDGKQGNMVIGNPCDDWNLMEELNKYMDVPRNHPGALADVGFEHDRYEAVIINARGPMVQAQLQNHQPDSAGGGLVKDLILAYNDNTLRVEYLLPGRLSRIQIEFGLSPDYLSLLRYGRWLLRAYDRAGARGWSTGVVTVWVKPGNGDCTWTKPPREEFGHGCSLRLASRQQRLILWIGIDIASPDIVDEGIAAAHDWSKFSLRGAGSVVVPLVKST